MNVKQIIAGLKTIANMLEILAPAAGAIGGDSVVRIISISSAVIKLAEMLEARIAEGKVVASTDDVASIRRFIDKIKLENDRLNEVISAS